MTHSPDLLLKSPTEAYVSIVLGHDAPPPSVRMVGDQVVIDFRARSTDPTLNVVLANTPRTAELLDTFAAELIGATVELRDRAVRP